MLQKILDKFKEISKKVYWGDDIALKVISILETTTIPIYGKQNYNECKFDINGIRFNITWNNMGSIEFFKANDVYIAAHNKYLHKIVSLTEKHKVSYTKEEIREKRKKILNEVRTKLSI